MVCYIRSLYIYIFSVFSGGAPTIDCKNIGLRGLHWASRKVKIREFITRCVNSVHWGEILIVSV